MNRADQLSRLQADGPFDVLVIGGGATGLGAAVEAATRGHRVALIEQADFAKGTSSRATKLVHGGVRYLKQGNISLVRDALLERGRLLANAPHLTRNLAFVIPSYGRWDRFFYGTGLKMYDLLAGEKSLGGSRTLTRDETVALLPNIETHGLSGGVIYQDGQFDDARLALNLAQTVVDHGGVVVNYCTCTGFFKTNGRISGVRARDEESGTEFEVRAKVVINATGVFVDSLRSLESPESAPLVTVSQGIHIVLPKSFLPGDAALMVPKTEDGRVLFVVPWHDCVVVGTTDTPRPVAELEPRALDEERSFVMEHARKYLARDPADGDVLSIFAGLRPLVKTTGQGSTASLSRDHTIVLSEGGLITITGGKWTTYRKMGEDVINRAETAAGLSPRASVTADLKIHGWAILADPSEQFGQYGVDAKGILALLKERPELDAPIHPLLACRQVEVIWHVRHEMARTIEDVLARRSRSLLLNAHASIEAARLVATLLAEELKRDAGWERAQVDAYTRLARGYVFTDPASRARTAE
ncbi:MAG: glycerol-3-phosphate dehydrogenase/oxidase [Rariglobus sp.]